MEGKTTGTFFSSLKAEGRREKPLGFIEDVQNLKPNKAMDADADREPYGTTAL